MFLAPNHHHRLELPTSLRDKLFAFRRRVWAIKLIEAAGCAIFGVLAAYLATFVLDRLWDTPSSVRYTVFFAALAACTIVPMVVYRWVWRQRRLDQLARLLSRTHASIGDQLLGIIELAENESEQARSITLCEAAIEQVAQRAEARDFSDSVPNPRHVRWSVLALGSAAVGVLLLALYPAAAANAWARFVKPWGDTPRYTFAMIDELPDRLIVAHGEPFTMTVKLAEQTASRPVQAEARVGAQGAVAAQLADDQYAFEMPPQIDPVWLDLRVGDFTKRIRLEPTLRPELSSVQADIALPPYLGRTEAGKKDVRGGTLSLVKGSRATLAATATRDLASAMVNLEPVTPQGARVIAPETVVKGDRQMKFEWQDHFQLKGKEPFVLTINGRDDEPPTVVSDGLPSRRVVLDSEYLNFKVRAEDDFGVKKVGLEWRGTDKINFKNPAVGERVLAAGGPDKEVLELAGTFSAKALGIEPQPILVRLFAEDYFPGRERVYSPTYLLYVLNAEQHMIWLTEQLSKWHRQSLDVRDRELQLFETNKQLRQLSAEQLEEPDTRRRIENQAEAERANGRRLSNLVANGEDLVQQAMRNPEFGVGHLEKWAEMLQILKDISNNRMPTVADLLKQSAQAPKVAQNTPGSNRPTVGQVRASGPGKPKEGPKEPQQPQKPVPAIVDVESSQQALKPKEDQKPSQAKPSSPKFGLPVTSLMGGKPPKESNTPAETKLDEAIVKQQDLLAEFEKIADELNRVLANLEGSTLVKRLKAASRLQARIAGRLGDQVGDAFGVSIAAPKVHDLSKELASQEMKSSQDLSNIMDDMQAYFERRRFAQFKNVLDDMIKLDVLGNLRQLSDDLPKENGLSMAQCEYWSDTFDRWAEDLVDPACCGSCPGCKSRGSLPPSIVLEVLQVLEAEVNLREDTRVAEQAKKAVAKEIHAEQAAALSRTQRQLQERIVKVTQRIRELPEGEELFAKEIRLLGAVAEVMDEATKILAGPDTGSKAIAAETEAIELLLQSKRFNPNGGGGGGANPGGGGGGTTTDSALSLIGKGANEKEVRESQAATHATGETGATLPEEFRAGLDTYFNRLEKGSKER
jgi:hypothetical protein